MANIKNIPIMMSMPNLLHVLQAFVDEEKTIANMIVEINSGTINKYEIITETGHLKLDRVGYSSLAYPVAYGAIPMTLDEDGDALDIVLANVTEPITPGTLVEARIIGVMKFIDGDEVDDKIVAVIDADKRMNHIKSVEDLGEHWMKEVSYYFEHYKDLKKPGTCKVEGYFDIKKAVEIIEESEKRYDEFMEKEMEKLEAEMDEFFQDSCECDCSECEDCDCENCSCENCECENCDCHESEEEKK